MYYLRLKKYENRLKNTPDQLYVFSAHNNCVLTGLTHLLLIQLPWISPYFPR
jgi:hypothetical protein